MHNGLKFRDANGDMKSVSTDNPLPVAGGAGGGGLTDAELRATPVPVSGPLTNTQLNATMGTPGAAAWDGVASSATVIQILKHIAAQNATMIAHLAAIEANTATP